MHGTLHPTKLLHNMRLTPHENYTTKPNKQLKNRYFISKINMLHRHRLHTVAYHFGWKLLWTVMTFPYTWSIAYQEITNTETYIHSKRHIYSFQETYTFSRRWRSMQGDYIWFSPSFWANNPSVSKSILRFFRPLLWSLTWVAACWSSVLSSTSRLAPMLCVEDNNWE